MTSILRITIKQGVIMGLCFCVYTITMWLTKLDSTYLRVGQYFDVAIILLPIIMIFWAIREALNLYQITVFQRIFVAIFVGAVSFLIYDPFLYLYHNYINPEWFTAVLNLKEVELKASDVSQIEITNTLQKMSNANINQSGIFKLSTLIPSVIIIPTLIALVSNIFIRVKGNK
ncbi:DUF4199 domain-containing protein [Flavobacterium sedimenticola]|uniref:DUF4199 domain-containing protein n=1 Tax=Flavobacterium sedimenticola TaxID=3043286 RepID=A0ABT6XS35_9FLAO|nr:DUF4199 domain-containing protein [Flavobacterium sedimenticola]MDI9257906.1 DUF4199 domain-containing protein [Flavobacterium sedimenticola]